MVAAGATNDDTQYGGSRYLDDVWSSRDGQEWASLLPHATWAPRLAHALVPYQGRLWLIGGEVASRNYATDIWTTTDCVQWRQETDQYGWPGRLYGGGVVFRNKVWIAGGWRREGAALNDVWSFEARNAAPQK